MNSRDRRVLGRAPDKLKEIIALLPPGWKIERHGPSGMGWAGELSFGKTLFKLVEDRCYIGVSSIKDGRMTTIEPPEDQRLQISLEQVCDLLKQGVENWERE